jgi:hypothetical protein
MMSDMLWMVCLIGLVMIAYMVGYINGSRK